MYYRRVDAPLRAEGGDDLVGLVLGDGVMQSLEGTRQQLVIGIHEHDIFPSGFLHASATSGRHAAILGMDHPDAGILLRRFVAEVAGAVGTAVVHGHYLEAFEVLHK